MKCAIGEVEWNYPLDYAEAIEVAIEALEKQIKKKPKNIYSTKYIFSYECPACGTKHVNEWCGTNAKLPFCSICGQALDWRETE